MYCRPAIFQIFISGSAGLGVMGSKALIRVAGVADFYRVKTGIRGGKRNEGFMPGKGLSAKGME